jgi:hypothetical protein
VQGQDDGADGDDDEANGFDGERHSIPLLGDDGWRLDAEQRRNLYDVRLIGDPACGPCTFERVELEQHIDGRLAIGSHEPDEIAERDLRRLRRQPTIIRLEPDPVHGREQRPDDQSHEPDAGGEE